MSDEGNDNGPTIPGPYIPPHQTETSPLNKTLFGSTKHSIVNWLWGWDFSLEGTGSLRTIVIFLFGTAGIVTLALLTQVYYGEYELVRHGAIVSDHPHCTDIGLLMLEKGGHAVDAAIAATLCLGVVHFHITGLGGGGFLLGYNQRQEKVIDVINFAPSAPMGAYTNLTEAGHSVGIPGMLAGLWSAHQKHGKLQWADLVMPSVLLARYGFPVSDSLLSARSCFNPTVQNKEFQIIMESLAIGKNISLPGLAATLELIANKGIDVFYNGSLADEVVYIVKVGKGNMTLSDLSGYSPTAAVAEKATFLDYSVIVPASSFGGTLLLNALKNIAMLEFREDVGLTADTVRKVSDELYDAMMSLSKSENGRQVNSPGGTAVVVMDADDNYVSTVTGLNSILGSQLFTHSGFVLNNALVNGGFNSDGRPISLMTPVVVVERQAKCGSRYVSGAADSRTLTQVLMQLIAFKKPVNNSVEAPRFHVGPIPRSITVESNHEPRLRDITITALESMKISIGDESACPTVAPPLPQFYNSINILGNHGDSMWPYADSRGGGEASQF